MAFEALPNINSHLITTSWMVSKKAYETHHFHLEEAGGVVFFGFRPDFSVDKWFAQDNNQSFGEVKMKRDQFPCMRSIGNNEDATVNQAFLKNLELIITDPRASFFASVKGAVDSRKQIVFTGHSSGGATAILATVWCLETYFRTDPFGLLKPRCVTFGAPLVGDKIFKHALGREKWSQFFLNFVTRFDIVPRIMLARMASVDKNLPYVLSLLGPTGAPIQENDQTIRDFFADVLKDTATVAYRAVCELIGNGEAFLETLSSFLELSPYRPVGTFVFSTGTRLISVNNSDAILQILFYASQASNEHEWSLIPSQSMKDHKRYEELVSDAFEMKLSNRLDLHHLPLAGENSIVSALNDLGLSTRARLCVRAALEAEKQLVENQKKIDDKLPDIKKKLAWIEDTYKPMCLTHKSGYYDSFKASSDEIDFTANVKRAELAGIYDEVLGLVKKGQLPDVFDGRSEWIKEANRYRRLIEPIDIANYYRHVKNEDTGPYMVKGRPTRYIHAHRGYEHEQFKKTGVMIGEAAFWSKVNALNLGSPQEMEKELKISGSQCGSCFWAEVEEIKGKKYEEVEIRIKTLERLLEGWIQEGELDREIFLEGSTFQKWWTSVPENHKLHSPLRQHFVDVTRPT